MLDQALDFKNECDALYEVIRSLSNEDLKQKTGFKEWTINNIIGHLHTWNIAANRSLTSDSEFANYVSLFNVEYSKRQKMSDFENVFLEGREGQDLIELWHKFYPEMSNRFKEADPKKRVKWMGPDMSVKSSITARLMETWAHGQAVYDILGIVRKNQDHIKNITISNFKDNDFYSDYEYIIEFENYYQSFSSWIKTKNIKTIGLPYVPTGNWKKIYKKLINKNPSINFVYLHRKYDMQAWKFANKGFFNFKKHIPELISKL